MFLDIVTRNILKLNLCYESPSEDNTTTIVYKSKRYIVRDCNFGYIMSRVVPKCESVNHVHIRRAYIFDDEPLTFHWLVKFLTCYENTLQELTLGDEFVLHNMNLQNLILYGVNVMKGLKRLNLIRTRFYPDDLKKVGNRNSETFNTF